MHEKIDEEELKTYNQMQIEEILKYKWIESEKVGHDIGEMEAAKMWIKQFASIFRKEHLK